MVPVTSTLILSLFIFISRVCDVSMDTIRIIFISKEKKITASILGFFQVLIWIIAIQQIMTNITSFWLYIAYAGGFAMGTFIGITIEDKLSLGKVLIRIVTTNDSEKLIKHLKEENFIVTVSEAEGRKGKVKMILTVIDRKKLQDVSDILNKYGKKSFYTIEDMRYVKEMDYSKIPSLHHKKRIMNRISHRTGR